MLTQSPSRINFIQSRLLILAAGFLFIYSTALTFAPAVRLRSWEAAYNWRHWFGFLVWLALALFAHRQTARRLPDRDPFVLPIALLLSGWGTLTVWRLYPDFGLRQSVWMLVIFAIFLFGLRLPSDLVFLRNYKYLWLTGGLLLTALTLLFGTNPAGTVFPRLWLGCCGVYFQPSEPLKLLLIIYLSAYLATGINGERSSGQSLSPRLLLLLAPTLLLTGIALLLLLAQRDLGTASIFLFLYTAIVYVASGRKRILLIGALAVGLAAVAGYILFDVVRVRMDAWLNPWLDPSGRSYQIVQSLIAIANGGVFGRGPGLGNPGLVPVPHSDFIFAAIAEETGLLGIIGLLTLFALLANRGLRIALHAPDTYRRYLAAGLTAHLVTQSVLIIGGNLRLLPLTGVTLPFVSYGGSSLLTSFLSLLILLHISNKGEEAPASLPNPRPYLALGSFLLMGLGAAALVSGWWAVYRSEGLVARTDNPRRIIADRFVYRGAILDRNSQPLSATQGEAGSFTRQNYYPSLSPVSGYSNPTYGQAGLEESLDGYLRGVQGNPASLLAWNQLLYGQPPPGLDVRLSLDLNIQQIADEQLNGHKGALVLLNAESGEILAMASHPTYDANRLEQEWDGLVTDPDSPLLNRAVLGRYPVGSLEDFLFPDGPASLTLNPAPQVRLPAGETTRLGQGELLLSPLQLALSAATLSGKGIRPAPILAVAVQTPQAGWVILPPLEEPVEALGPGEAQAAAERLAEGEKMIWQTGAVAPNGPNESATWYIGGTLPQWSGTPLAIAVLLEENNPAQSEEIGQAVMQAAMGQR